MLTELGVLDGVTEHVTDEVCDGVCDGVWLFGKDSFEERPLTATGVARTTKVGSCGDAAENGGNMESTGDGGRRGRRGTRDGCGTKCPEEKENG